MSPTPRIGYRNTQPNFGNERARPRRARHNRTRTQPHTASAERSHTYVTHLIEFGYPERFVQEQVGHAYAATTAIYTSVSNDFKQKTLKTALKRVYSPSDQRQNRGDR